MKSIELKRLSLCFDGIQAIDDLSFEVDHGTITAIIGPNGSGKTTLMNVLTGWYVPDRGSIMIRSVKKLKIHREECRELGIARTFQESRVFGQMTVMDNLFLCLTARHPFMALKSTRSDGRASVERTLKQVDLWDTRDHLAASLSYGQKKLLEIARVMLLGSEIILLDEPFAGLFAETVQRIVRLIRIMKEEGKTVLLIEHNMSLVRALTDHVIVLDSGGLLAQGSADEVLSDRKVVEAYLGD